MKLRTTLTFALVTLVAIALSAAVALVLLTTRLHGVTARLGTVMDDVQLAEEILIDLRALDALSSTPGDLEIPRRAGDLRARLDRLAGRELPDERGEALRLAVAAANRYLDAPPGTAARGPLEEARAELRRFVRLNAAAGRAERADAARWDRFADVWGVTAVAILVVGTAAELLLLRRRLFRPMIAISRAISAYAHGERAARIEETGGEELREIARTFNDMAERLERQRDERLVFLAGLAHDLRNPLSAMRMASRVIAGDGAASERTRAKVALLDRQIDRLDQLAGQFLDSARVEAGQLELALELRDLRELAASAASLFAGSSAVHHVEVAPAASPLPVRCDPGRLEQVLNNLLGNALKYSPDGGRVTVSTFRRQDRAVLAVSDEGVGISPDDLRHIFEPFRRGSRLTSAVPGLGLGLATSRKIVERHGGAMTVASRPAHGSTFEIELPLAQEAAAARA